MPPQNQYSSPNLMVLNISFLTLKIFQNFFSIRNPLCIINSFHKTEFLLAEVLGKTSRFALDVV